MTENNSFGRNSSSIEASFKAAFEYDQLIWNEIRKNPRYKLSSGPKYHITTSADDALEVLTLYYNSTYLDKKLSNYYLVGLHPKLGIVARKNVTIEQNQNSRTAHGKLVTAYRGYGFGTAMELVQADILQREANQRGEIVWSITDQNNADLLTEQKTITEHERWLSIYGRFKGKLEPDFYKPKYSVTFSPQGENHCSLENINEVFLERKDKLAIPQITMFANAVEKAELQAERITQIFTFLGKSA